MHFIALAFLCVGNTCQVHSSIRKATCSSTCNTSILWGICLSFIQVIEHTTSFSSIHFNTTKASQLACIIYQWKTIRWNKRTPSSYGESSWDLKGLYVCNERRGHSEDRLCTEQWTATNLGFVKPKAVWWDGLQGMFCQQPLHYTRVDQ